MGEEADEYGGISITEVDGRFVVFPDPAAVFVADQQDLARLFHPLVSIDLAAVDPTWTGHVHLISPVDPEYGAVEEESGAYAGAESNGAWLTFRMQEDGRWRFVGDVRVLAVAADAARGDDEAVARIAEVNADFAACRGRWQQYGILSWGDPDDPMRPRAGAASSPLIDQFGGTPPDGNWVVGTLPAGIELDESDADVPVLRLFDGRPFHFIAATSGYPWRWHGADAILLFFEPETRTAVLTFDFS
ncbi:hypothetical protein [Microbacterium testaceum]|uniref:hypothetical protein n=1 Tax=Microbacterium testaceum TaxID=2033 RepID=UPI002435BC70|nr:hypothetical protein [Microbacterium testaceum]